jgi:hypothetical protein
MKSTETRPRQRNTLNNTRTKGIKVENSKEDPHGPPLDHHLSRGSSD